MSKSAWSVALLLVGAMAAPTAGAAIASYNQSLVFNAANQSFWGPGGSAASFSAKGLMGSQNLGIS